MNFLFYSRPAHLTWSALFSCWRIYWIVIFPLHNHSITTLKRAHSVRLHMGPGGAYSAFLFPVFYSARENVINDLKLFSALSQWPLSAGRRKVGAIVQRHRAVPGVGWRLENSWRNIFGPDFGGAQSHQPHPRRPSISPCVPLLHQHEILRLGPNLVPSGSFPSGSAFY